jgi:amino acid adenylation domain-containing protein
MSATEKDDAMDLDARLARLSPAQRELLERRLLERSAAVAADSRIPRRGADVPTPLSYSQELLWLLSQLEGKGVAYNAPAAFRLHGPVDADVLQRALEGLVARHEILRTRYDLVDDGPMQIIEDVGLVQLEVVDLSDLAEGERDAELQRLLHAESEHAFDLRVDPVLRPFLIRLGADDHVFFNVMHHIATDGWSRAVLHHDLSELYDAIVESREPELVPLAIQYADYAVWHRNWLDGGVLEQQLDFWKETLRSAPSRLELPTDKPRPAVRAYEGDHTSRMLPMDLRHRLEVLGREGEATLFIALLAAFATLLHRYSGQDDIVMGTPFAGRNRSELESMIGYFINPLALRVDASDDPTFRELLQRTRQTTLSAFEHADVPYEMVVRATTPQRDLSQTPVFQVMMVLHNPDWERVRPKFEPRGTNATEIVHEKGWAKFDLLLGMSQRANGLNTTWEYSTELFEDATVKRIACHFEKLLESIVDDPDLPISRLPMLLEEERQVILSRWAKAPAEFPQDVLVKDMFEAWAKRTPEADAVVFEGARRSYRELDERANRLAHRLRDLGVGPGRLVGIYMTKSLDLVTAVLAVVKAGGAYVPLDPMYPGDRIEFMLEDSRPAVIVTEAGLTPPIDALDDVALFSEWDELDRESAGPLPTVASPDDLAYVIYTSGSTGRPKGAMITNASLANAYHAYEDAYRLTDETTSHLQMASFSFDVFTGDVIRSLLSGSKLVLCPLETVMDPAQLFNLLVDEQIDCAEFVPAVTSLLFEHVESIGKTLDFMRVLIVSSEGWRTDKHEAWTRLTGPRTRLINAYGLTEATIDSTYFEAEEALVADRFVPIGKPLANSEIYLLDSNLELVPIGIPGELCIGGAGVALGYLNRPELTAERFVDNPFAPGTRLYRTGDLARWLPDGNVEFLGRSDRQLKIRGFRIEPGEIEAVLERHPGVRAAAVLSWERRAGDARLVAYVEPMNPSDAPAWRDLRELLAAELPAFMVPSALTVVDTFPLTPNGKLDRDSLPPPELGEVDHEEGSREPETETERGLAELWCTLLGIETVGAEDNFFALGGHSLLAVRLMGEVDRRFGVKLPLTALFEASTIEAMAARIDKDRGADTWGTLVPLRAEGSKPPLYLLHGRDGELLHYRDLVRALDPDQPVYGFQPPGLDGREQPLLEVTDMAAHYLAELRSFQPEGPYLLGGYCFSGALAYELGAQLAQQGDAPALLALVDAVPVGTRQPPTRLQLERQKFGDFMQRDLRGKVAWIRKRAKGVVYKIRTRSKFVLYTYFSRTGRSIPKWLRNVEDALQNAIRTYKTPASALHLTLFRAAETAEAAEARATEWRGLAEVVVRPIIGEGIRHDNMIRPPFVSMLAAELDECIDAALASYDAPDAPAVLAAADVAR